MSFSQEAPNQALLQRRLLCEDIQQAHQAALNHINKLALPHWQVSLGDTLIFDLAGLQAISKTLLAYQGTAHQLEIKLKLSAEAIRDYYSHNQFLDKNGLVSLPITAQNTRAHHTEQTKNAENIKKETLIITLDELTTAINYPNALTKSNRNSTPLALLIPYSCDHDFLFANQIAIFSALNNQLRKSPISWIRAALSRRKIGFKQGVSLAWKNIHRTANIHPTAVVEGSVIGKGCRIGAHCVVRYSVLGDNIQLHDGAKVEYSVVDDNSWLMHDLVLYRCLVESDVFLIHGPYQFSYFQKESAAFASIMMDYRPDNKPIRINNADGVCEYKGRFLGALLEEKAKVFGGTLTAPGITIPAKQEISCDINTVTTYKNFMDTTPSRS